MRDDERQRVLVLRLHMDEMNVETVDRRDELRKRVQLRFALSPVVPRRPVLGERTHRRGLHALRRVRNGFTLGPLRRFDAAIQIGELRIGEADTKWTNLGASTGFVCLDFRHHVCHGLHFPRETDEVEPAGGDA